MVLTKRLLVHADQTTALTTTCEVETTTASRCTALDRRARSFAHVALHRTAPILHHRVFLDRTLFLVDRDSRTVIHAVQMHPFSCRCTKHSTTHRIVTNFTTQVTCTTIIHRVTFHTHQRSYFHRFNRIHFIPSIPSIPFIHRFL